MSKKNTPDHLFQKALKAHQSGNLKKAEAGYKKIIKRDPTYSDAYHLLGVIQANQLQEDEAIQNIQHAIELDECEYYFNSLGNVYLKKGLIQQSCHYLKKALEMNDQYVDAYNNLGQALLLAGECVEAMKCFEKMLSLKFDAPPLFSNYLSTLNYLPQVSHEMMLQAHLNFNHLFQSTKSYDRHKTVRRPKKVLRVGYVSPDFCRGSVGFFIDPILRNHNPDAFKIYCYANVHRPDDVTSRMQSYVNHWVDTDMMSDDQMAKRIFQDQIDILVDICGHFSCNRLPVFARHPAPIQITYLGYPNTTGLSSIQYRLTDSIVDPDERDRFHSEKLIRLPSPFLCYQPLDNSPEISDLPAKNNGYITLGSFNNLAKINDQVVLTWAKILKQLPTAKLFFKARPFADLATCQRVQQRFQNHGISSDRLILKGHVDSIVLHLEAYHTVDLALDPFPYHGTTTTCDALWMGVPVVSLCGDCHASRVGATLLTSIGLTDLIVYSESEYVNKTVKICQNLDLLSSIRHQLRPLMQRSKLIDGKAFTISLEDIYRSLWFQENA